jgi:integrase
VETDGLLFPGRDPSKPLAHGAADQAVARPVDKAGLTPLGLHEARHTAASLFIAAGLNAKTVATYLGHANIAVTFDRYGHLFPGSEDEARRLLDTYLEGA